MTAAGRDRFASQRVRPYLLTGGRTRSAVDLQLESLVKSTSEGISRVATLEAERRRIVELCIQPQSVAEVSARLSIHLQVARILCGDLIAERLLSSHASTAAPTDRPDVRLLERVLDGLQSL